MKKEEKHIVIRFLLGSNFLHLLGAFLLWPLLAIFILDIGGEPKAIVVTHVLYNASLGSLLLFFGRWEDTMKRPERFIFLGYGLSALAVSLLFFVDRPATLYPAMTVYALGGAVLGPAWKAYFVKAQSHGHERFEWSLLDGGSQLIIALGGLVSGIAYTLGGFRAIFGAMLVLEILAAALSIRIIPLRGKNK